MRTLTTVLLGAMLCSTLSAQDVIVRQRNGTSHFYYGPNTGATIQGVIDDAANGDTIHLAGVNYAITNNLIINKGVVIMGSGIQPDSSSAYAGRTHFNQAANVLVLFVTNSGGDASSAEAHGITFTETVAIGNGGGNLHPSTFVSGLKLFRCDFVNLALGWNVDNSGATETLIRSCIVRGNLRVNRAVNTHIQNSFIKLLTYGGNGTTVVNCVFMDFNHIPGNGNANVVYRSNIFLRQTGSAPYAITEASSFQNNLYVIQPGSVVSWPGAVVAENNLSTTVMANVFANNTSFTDFAFNRNYHIVPGPYQTMAFDGGEVGVYGTNGQPMKDGLLPFNPHWSNLSAQGSTSGGTLQNVNIKGSAQTH